MEEIGSAWKGRSHERVYKASQSILPGFWKKIIRKLKRAQTLNCEVIIMNYFYVTKKKKKGNNFNYKVILLFSSILPLQ